MQTSGTCALLLGLLSLSACAAPPTDQAKTNLSKALTYAPQSASSLIFTDWAMARHEAQMDSLNLDSSDADKSRFYEQQDRTWTTFSPTISTFSGDRAQRWGTNVIDFEWSATMTLPLDPMNDTNTEFVDVIQLRQTADLDRISHFLLLNGYEIWRNDEAKIYTATAKSIQAMQRTSDPEALRLYEQMLAIALIPEQRILITAHSRQGIDSVLDSYQHAELSFALAPGVQETVAQLGGVSTALIQSYDDLCSEYQAEQIIGQLHENDQHGLQEALGPAMATLHSYQALGFGYRMEGTQPTAIATLAYADAEAARSDREARLRLATEGYALKKHYSYHRTAFTATPQASAGDSITLVLTSDDPTAETFHNMAAAHDFLFAACN